MILSASPDWIHLLSTTQLQRNVQGPEMCATARSVMHPKSSVCLCIIVLPIFVSLLWTSFFASATITPRPPQLPRQGTRHSVPVCLVIYSLATLKGSRTTLQLP